MNTLRIVDATQLVKIGDVMDILNDLTDALAKEHEMLSGPIWNRDTHEYDPATPHQVLSAAQDRVAEVREQILWLLR